MDTLTMLGLLGFLVITLGFGLFLDVIDRPASIDRAEFNIAYQAYERSVDSLSPISDLAKFMAEDNGKARP